MPPGSELTFPSSAPPGRIVWLAANAFGLIAGWAAGIAVVTVLRVSQLDSGSFALVLPAGGALVGFKLIAGPLLRPGRAAEALPWLVALQVGAFLAALFLPFGFDHPSALGLDFGHLLLLAVLDGSALVLGLGLAFATRRWLLCAFQLGLPGLFFLLVATGLVSR